MIIKNGKTISSVMKGNQVIDKIMKGTLVVYEAFKNLIASGVPPLTLTKCKGLPLLDYKIYGKSVQDGTPTPDTPIEIKSVSGKNLIDTVPIDNSNIDFSQYCVTEYIYDEEIGHNILKITANNLYPSVRYELPSRLERDKYYCLKFKYKFTANSSTTNAWIFPNGSGNPWDNLNICGEEYRTSPSANWIDRSIKFHIKNSVYDSQANSYKYMLLSLGYGPQDKVFYMADMILYEISKEEYDDENYVALNYEPYGHIPVKVSATGYEPITTYIKINEPLRSLPNGVKDIAYIKNGKLYVERKVGSVDLSELNWNNTMTNFWVSKSLSNIKYTSSNTIVGNGIAEKYKMAMGSGLSGADKLNHIAIDVAQIGVNTDKGGVSGIFVYELAEPITEEIGEAPNIPTFKGTTIIDVDTKIKPSNMEVTYKGKEN